MKEENKEEQSPAKSPARKRKRRNRPFPKLIFEEAIKLAEAIQKHASGQKVRRLTLFDTLSKSPDSSASRELITSSAQYGLTKGSYGAEFLELTSDGSKATSPESSQQEKCEARIKCAIDQVAPYRELYEGFKGNRLPSREVLFDRLREIEIDDDYLSEGVR